MKNVVYDSEMDNSSGSSDMASRSGDSDSGNDYLYDYYGS